MHDIHGIHAWCMVGFCLFSMSCMWFLFVLHAFMAIHACMHPSMVLFNMSCYVSLLTCHVMSCHVMSCPCHVMHPCPGFMHASFLIHACHVGQVLVPDLILLLLRPTVATGAGKARQVTQGRCGYRCHMFLWNLLLAGAWLLHPLVCGSSFWAPVNVVLGKCPGC